MDEYALKAFGLLPSVEIIRTVFGLKLSCDILSASEQVSPTVPKKHAM